MDERGGRITMVLNSLLKYSYYVSWFQTQLRKTYCHVEQSTNGSAVVHIQLCISGIKLFDRKVHT